MNILMVSNNATSTHLGYPSIHITKTPPVITDTRRLPTRPICGAAGLLCNPGACSEFWSTISLLRLWLLHNRKLEVGPILWFGQKEDGVQAKSGFHCTRWIATSLPRCFVYHDSPSSLAARVQKIYWLVILGLSFGKP